MLWLAIMFMSLIARLKVEGVGNVIVRQSINAIMTRRNVMDKTDSERLLESMVDMIHEQQAGDLRIIAKLAEFVEKQNSFNRALMAKVTKLEKKLDGG